MKKQRIPISITSLELISETSASSSLTDRVPGPDKLPCLYRVTLFFSVCGQTCLQQRGRPRRQAQTKSTTRRYCDKSRSHFPVHFRILSSQGLPPSLGSIMALMIFRIDGNHRNVSFFE